MNNKLKNALIGAKKALNGELADKEYIRFFECWNVADSWHSQSCKRIDDSRLEISDEVDTTFQIMRVNNDAKYSSERPIQKYYAFMNGRLLSPVGTDSFKQMLRIFIVPLIRLELANNRTYFIKAGNEVVQIDLDDYKEPLPGQDYYYQDLFEVWNEDSNMFGGFEKINPKEIVLDYEKFDFRTIFQRFYCIGTETTYTLMDGRLIGECSHASVDKRDYRTIANELEQQNEGWVLINSKGELVEQSKQVALKRENKNEG
jgi:hypothetical protein